MSGFVLIHRSLWDHPAFKDRVEAASFSWMVSAAAWKPVRVRYKGRVLNLDRGQLAISTRDMAADWGWSESKVRRFLEKLKNEAMIDAHSDAGVTVVTICNYNEYQSHEHRDDAPADAEPTQDRRTADAQNKEENNLKEKKEEVKDSRPPISDDEQSAFDAYNDLAKRIDLPVAQVTGDTRKSKLRQRLSECGGLSGWVAALEKLEASSFLRGGNANGWKADLDFILQAKSFTKLLEGSYDDRKPTSSPTRSTSGIASDEERRRRLAAAAQHNMDHGRQTS